MKTLLDKNKKIAIMAMSDNDYFEYWARKADNIYADASLSYYEKIIELKRCVDNMRFWKDGR